MGRQYRTGTDEIMAAVWYLREPVYILGALRSRAVHVQMYHLDVVDVLSERRASVCGSGCLAAPQLIICSSRS